MPAADRWARAVLTRRRRADPATDPAVGTSAVRTALARWWPVVFVPAALPTVIRLVGDGDHAWPILVVTFTPTALPVLAALTVGALASRRWRIGIAGALAVALNVVWLAPLYVADTPPVGTDLVAMTTNIQYGWGKPAEIVAAVRDRHVDLLAVEELTPEAVTGLGAAGLDALLPYRVVAPGTLAHGSGLWSRFPLTPGEAWDGVHHMPGATVHIPADGGVRDVIVRVAHPYRTARYNATSYRRDQSMLRERMAALPRDVPAIVLGDFNASRDHAAFRRYLGDGWRDAPEVAGSGLIPTWSPRYWIPPLVQLDHILISRQFGARSASAFDIDGSDHQALVARLVLARTV